MSATAIQLGDAFVKLGVSAQKLSQKTPEEQFYILANAIAAIDNPSQKAAVAMDVFGKSGTALPPMLNLGVEGIEQRANQASKLAGIGGISRWIQENSSIVQTSASGFRHRPNA